MLLYQLKGYTEEEATALAQRVSHDPDLFLKTMAQEELGLSERHFPNPLVGAVSAALSTAVGGILPILPFFFVRGTAAVIAAALVGMAAHFVVGAAKSIITARSWWASGLEMTVIGFITVASRLASASCSALVREANVTMPFIFTPFSGP